MSENQIDLDVDLENVLPYSHIPYWSIDYWNNYYRNRTAAFEWFTDFSMFKGVVMQHISNKTLALDLGCGSSSLGRDLIEDAHFQKVVCLDFSSVVIEKMKEEDISGLDYQVGDCTRMRFAPNRFDAIFDKGTLDCILCSPHGQQAALQALSEISRVLKTGGVYILISAGCPSSRTRLLQCNSLFNIVSMMKVTTKEGECPTHYLYIIRKMRELSVM